MIIMYYIVLYHIPSYNIISYHIISYYSISYYIIWYHITLHYTILYYIVLYCIVLYYILLFYIIDYYSVLYIIVLDSIYNIYIYISSACWGLGSHVGYLQMGMQRDGNQRMLRLFVPAFQRVRNVNPGLINPKRMFNWGWSPWSIILWLLQEYPPSS